MGLDEGMSPEETHLLTSFEPDDVGMRSELLVVIDTRANVWLVVDEAVECVIAEKLAGESGLEALLAECQDLRKYTP